MPNHSPGGTDAKLPPAPEPFALPYPWRRACWALEVIGWSKRELAPRLELEEGSTRQMLRGVRLLPDVLGMWLETKAQFELAYPEPFNWRPKRERTWAEAALEGEENAAKATGEVANGVPKWERPEQTA